MLRSPKDKVALITGGASGLGEATARRFVAAGGKVLLLDLNEERGAILTKEFGEQNALFAKTDVTSEESVQGAIQAGVAKFGTIHVVVNCAGMGGASRVVSKKGAFPLKLFQKIVHINLIGTFNVARLAAVQMSKNEPDGDERGVIINVASVAAFEGQIGQAAYSASKGGVVSMTLPMARELGELGIRVVTVAPGIIDTPMLGKLPDFAKEALGKGVPFPKRVGSPDEFAAVVQHVFENRYINGCVVRLDGALRMAPSNKL